MAYNYAISGMVCHRCVLSVEDILKSISLPFEKVTIGEIHLRSLPDKGQLAEFNEKLKEIDLHLLESREDILGNKIKELIISLIHGSDVSASQNEIHIALEKELPSSFEATSKFFKSYVGIPLREFVIQQRLERVKELLSYRDLTISEIAFKTGFSSSAHLSQLFKKHLGTTPTEFRSKGMDRTSLDLIGKV